MAKAKRYERLAWEDRFNQPAVEDLRDALTKEAAGYFDRLREHLLAQEGVNERVEWYGPSWRWAVAFHHPAAKDEPVAVIIPAPDDLQLAVPLDEALVEELATKSTKRAIRDGLELAQPPFNTNWGVWSIQFAGLIGELQTFIEIKHDRRLNGVRKR